MHRVTPMHRSGSVSRLSFTDLVLIFCARWVERLGRVLLTRRTLKGSLGYLSLDWGPVPPDYVLLLLPPLSVATDFGRGRQDVPSGGSRGDVQVTRTRIQPRLQSTPFKLNLLFSKVVSFFEGQVQDRSLEPKVGVSTISVADQHPTAASPRVPVPRRPAFRTSREGRSDVPRLVSLGSKGTPTTTPSRLRSGTVSGKGGD